MSAATTSKPSWPSWDPGTPRKRHENGAFARSGVAGARRAAAGRRFPCGVSSWRRRTVAVGRRAWHWRQCERSGPRKEGMVRVDRSGGDVARARRGCSRGRARADVRGARAAYRAGARGAEGRRLGRVRGGGDRSPLAPRAEVLVRKLALAAEPSGATVLLLTDSTRPRAVPWPVSLRLELSRPDLRTLSVRVAKDGALASPTRKPSRFVPSRFSRVDPCAALPASLCRRSRGDRPESIVRGPFPRRSRREGASRRGHRAQGRRGEVGARGAGQYAPRRGVARSKKRRIRAGQTVGGRSAKHAGLRVRVVRRCGRGALARVAEVALAFGPTAAST